MFRNSFLSQYKDKMCAANLTYWILNAIWKIYLLRYALSCLSIHKSYALTLL